jgi:hypothetical protein
MTTRKSKALAPEPPPRVLTVKDPALEQGKLKPLGGSRSDDFNSVPEGRPKGALDDALRRGVQGSTIRRCGWWPSWGSPPRTSWKACSPPKPWRPTTPPWSATAGRCWPSSRSRRGREPQSAQQAFASRCRQRFWGAASRRIATLGDRVLEHRAARHRGEARGRVRGRSGSFPKRVKGIVNSPPRVAPWCRLQ